MLITPGCCSTQRTKAEPTYFVRFKGFHKTTDDTDITMQSKAVGVVQIELQLSFFKQLQSPAAFC